MKSIFQSKVFWLAVLQALAAVAVVFQTSFPEVGWLLMSKSALDVLLRFYTSTAVKL